MLPMAFAFSMSTGGISQQVNITDSLTSVLAVASYFFSSIEEILALIFLSKRDVL